MVIGVVGMCGWVIGVRSTISAFMKRTDQTDVFFFGGGVGGSVFD